MFVAVICCGLFATRGHYLNTGHVHKEPSNDEKIAIAVLVGVSMLFLLCVAGMHLRVLIDSAVAAVLTSPTCSTFASASVIFC